MFEQEQKQAIIVYRKKEEEYSHLMANLISAFTEYEIAEWEEKDWIANKATTSSSQKVIFLGDSKEAQKRHLGMIWKFNQFNMKYGWLGNQCIVDVDLLSADDIRGFAEHYQLKASEYEEITENPTLRLPEKVLPEIPAETTEVVEVLDIEEQPSEKNRMGQARLFISKTYSEQKANLAKLHSNTIAPINNQIIIGKLQKFQYNLLVREFVINGGMKEFMEG